MAMDPNEWRNLAGLPEFAGVIAEHRKWLPTFNAPPAAGSKTRLLEPVGDAWHWEGELIEGPVPMDDPYPPVN